MQRADRVGLQNRIQRSKDAPTLRHKHSQGVFLKQGLLKRGNKIEGLPSASRNRRQREGFLKSCLKLISRDQVLTEHQRQHQIAPLAGDLRVRARGIVIGRLQQSREQRALTQRQLACRFTKIGPAPATPTPQTFGALLSPIPPVPIHLHKLPLLINRSPGKSHTPLQYLSVPRSLGI